MIQFDEIVPHKVPGLSSILITCDYNPLVVDIIKNESTISIFDKDTKTWEVPIDSLHKLIDKLCFIDDIKINFLKDKKQKEKRIDIDIKDFKTKPFDYQLDGIKYGLSHDTFLLLDAPGLGKTLQIIYIAEQLKKRDNIQHCLIICGINTLKYNWKKEIERHSKYTCKILGERITKRGKSKIGSITDRVNDLQNPIDDFFVITNIETIRNPNIIKELKKTKTNKFDMIIVDECHVCKNPQSTQGKNLLKLKAKYKIAATGTLLLNDPMDAYMPLKWIGADNASYGNFKYFYCNFTGPFGNILSGYKNIDLLKEQLETCSIRRTKDILKELPPKTIIHEIVEMDSDQQKFYEDVKNGIKESVDKVVLKTATILGLVTRLRQAATFPNILTTNDTSSAKVERCIDLTEQIVAGGDKVVVFSEFKEPLNYLYQKLSKYNPLLCTGDISDTIISDNISQFQSIDRNKVMLCTISKMGTGITLTAASYAIFIGSSWTAAQNLQCEDRIYRIGSDKPVFIYYLWTKDTIDEQIKDIVETKGLLSDYVIDDTCPPQLIDKLKDIITDL